MSIQFIKKDKIENIVGENLTLKNSSNSPFGQFKITGNSKQETRKGINFFNKDNISNLANASQGYLVEGTKIKSFFTECKPNTTYSAKRVNPSTDRFSIAFTSEAPADGVEITNIYPNPPNVDQSDNDVVISSTSGEDSQYVCITISNSAQKVPDIMLVEGYYTIDDFPEYEAYGASPSSDYPSEIQNVTSVAIKICNENILYDGFEEEFINRINSSTLASIVEKNGKKYLKFDASIGGTNYEDLNYFVKGFFKENTQYTFNSKLILSKSMETVNLKYIYTDGTKSYKNLDYSAKANEEFDYSFTSDEGKTIESLSVLYSLGITYMDLSTATIVEGTSTDYIERQTQPFNFPLLEGQKLCRKSESEYDYLSDEGIVNILEQIDETGTKTIEESFVVRETSLITPYTEEQQLVYNQIREACSYKNVTNIFSLDEVSPIFKITYKKRTNKRNFSPTIKFIN